MSSSAKGWRGVSSKRMAVIRDYQRMTNFDSKWIASLVVEKRRRYVEATFEKRRER